MGLGLLGRVSAIVRGRRGLPKRARGLPRQKELIYEFFGGSGRALLLVLDACRLDYLERHLGLLGGLRSYIVEGPRAVLSSGSYTREWLERTFDRPLKDVVYVSANPYVREFRDRFARVVELWAFAWDEELGTVRAGKVSEAVKLVLKRGAGKVIAHYLQPHAPFVRGSWLNRPFSHRSWGQELFAYELARRSPDARREFVRAYDENVRYALSKVAELASWALKRYKGMAIAITADHGECLGRWEPLRHFRKRIWMWLPWLLGLYKEVGHPEGCTYEELLVVPWLVLRQA